MPDTFPLTGLQAEWLRRCAGFPATAAPPEVLASLIDAGMLESTAEGAKVSDAGRDFLREKDLVSRRRIRDSRTHP